MRPADDDARALARALIADARHAALAVLDPASRAPLLSRIALVPGPDGAPLSLVSQLSAHTRALQADPRCALLLGEPGPKGDPLTHPRLSLQATAAFMDRDAPDIANMAALRLHYLRLAPKARVYVDFPDFQFLRFAILSGVLNGGFGKAFQLSPTDLGLDAP